MLEVMKSQSKFCAFASDQQPWTHNFYRKPDISGWNILKRLLLFSTNQMNIGKKSIYIRIIYWGGFYENTWF